MIITAAPVAFRAVGGGRWVLAGAEWQGGARLRKTMRGLFRLLVTDVLPPTWRK